MSHRASRVLRLDALARVEGEAALHLTVHDGTVTGTRLRIYEPPRFFEAFLVGRGHHEPPDITARICGICPVAYQMTSCQAIEAACGVTVDGPLAELRRLLYYGEWIESQSLHIHLLHAPDFFGHPSAVELARDQRAAVERGLRIKQAGNAVMEQLGGRAIHPVNVRVGGFYRVPGPAELAPLARRLRRAHDDALETVRWVSGFDFPDAAFDGPLLAMRDPGRYAIDSGTPAVLAASAGSDGAAPVTPFRVEEFERHVVERQVPHSTALVSELDGHPYLTGSLARYAVSGRWLHPSARGAAREAGLGDPAAGAVCRNPFRSIVVRAVEVVHAVAEALRIIDAYEPPARPYAEVPPRRATGRAATEAPRGLLYHRYAMDADGTLTLARIVPPTAQNQAAIEDDLRRQVQARLDRPDEAPGDAELTALCERAVRNHDPCISCSAHFLDLTVERG
ncbi:MULTISPECIES: Ni/Fe hydrogenase subunit alpha [Streptomyces]|uniref:Ni/Fe hydrogenase subunit alpha n=1 Tax=Streptomyces hygroscopicus TaxID=1912 RepID=A0ABQ3UE24_STRHY|nr:MULTISPECIES: nickel-dependent hydrogenase large subunit [Streptomyces]MCO8304132.1 nickel-dependent hydrogenase large subunit [Streptomyces sp. RKCA744]GHJ33807.1 Ni/Fe hydrogenase subunit alpha [Streptomyces hygroscopicus]